MCGLISAQSLLCLPYTQSEGHAAAVAGAVVVDRPVVVDIDKVRGVAGIRRSRPAPDRTYSELPNIKTINYSNLNLFLSDFFTPEINLASSYIS